MSESDRRGRWKSARALFSLVDNSRAILVRTTVTRLPQQVKIHNIHIFNVSGLIRVAKWPNLVKLNAPPVAFTVVSLNLLCSV